MNADNHSLINMRQSVDSLKSMAMDSCCKKLWREALDDFHGFTTQQEKIRNMVVLALKVLRKGVPGLEEADPQDAV
jgi:hypothetical protein